jgi:hypothetical protein
LCQEACRCRVQHCNARRSQIKRHLASWQCQQSGSRHQNQTVSEGNRVRHVAMVLGNHRIRDRYLQTPNTRTTDPRPHTAIVNKGWDPQYAYNTWFERWANTRILITLRPRAPNTHKHGAGQTQNVACQRCICGSYEDNLVDRADFRARPTHAQTAGKLVQTYTQRHLKHHRHTHRSYVHTGARPQQ